jgi:hypothetical protein
LGTTKGPSTPESAARAYLQAANKAAYELKRLEEEAAALASSSVHENEAVDRFLPGGF